MREKGFLKSWVHHVLQVGETRLLFLDGSEVLKEISEGKILATDPGSSDAGLGNFGEPLGSSSSTAVVRREAASLGTRCGWTLTPRGLKTKR